MQISYRIRTSTETDWAVIDKFEELRREFINSMQLADKKNKRKSKINVHNKFHVKRWGN